MKRLVIALVLLLVPSAAWAAPSGYVPILHDEFAPSLGGSLTTGSIGSTKAIATTQSGYSYFAGGASITGGTLVSSVPIVSSTSISTSGNGSTFKINLSP